MLASILMSGIIKKYANFNPILPIMEEIFGNLTALRAEGKIVAQTVDYVPLQWYESERNILRKTSLGGREVAFRLLKEGQRLKHDDVVFISTDLVLAIEILPSDVIVLSPQTLPEMARLLKRKSAISILRYF